VAAALEHLSEGHEAVWVFVDGEDPHPVESSGAGSGCSVLHGSSQSRSRKSTSSERRTGRSTECLQMGDDECVSPRDM
jgi:hypothetical protein